MTLTVANVDITTDTWQGLINKLNYVIEGVNVNFVTAGGNVTEGNVAINGVLTVNTANISSLSSNTATILTLSANTANTARLVSTVLVSNTFTSNSANVNTLTVSTANISNANVANASITGELSAVGGVVKVSGATPSVEIITNDVDSHDYKIFSANTNSITIAVDRDGDGTYDDEVFEINTTANTITAFGSRVWTDDDNGDTDSPDAQTLQGNDAAFYRNANNINAGTLSDSRLPTSLTGKTFTTGLTLNTTESQMIIMRPVANTGLAYLRWQTDTGSPLGYLGMDNVDGNLTFRRNTSGNIDIYAGSTGSSITMTSATLKHNSSNVWTEANFDPATKANLSGATFTSTIAIKASDTAGWAQVHSGSTTAPGYLALYNPDSTRAGYVGSKTGTTLRLMSENGLTGWTCTGTFTASGDITAFSDMRLKTEIVTIDNALSMIEQMRGVRFTKDGKRGIGVIAQEIQKVAPELVTEADDEMQTLSVAYGNAFAIAIEAIKELKAEVDSLKAQLEAK